MAGSRLAAPLEQGAVAGDGENCSWFLAEEGGDKNVFVPGERELRYWLPSLDGINALENAPRGVVCARGDDERAAAVPVNTHYLRHHSAPPEHDGARRVQTRA